MKSTNELTARLGIRYPIFQGPFGGGFSSARLAAAVSNAGGLGSFGVHALSGDEIGRVAREIRSLTSKPFALNLWVSAHDPGGLSLSQEEFDRAYLRFEPYFRELGVEKPQRPEQFHPHFEQQVDALLEANPAVFSFVFGVPEPRVLAECKRRGIVTVGCATTLDEALLVDGAGVDFIVASGFEAGGHRTSFLASAEDSLVGTFVLTQLVSKRVKAPVISAGGIVDGRGIRAAMLLGAKGAQLGTAFLACEESAATAEHRALLFSDASQRTKLTRAFTGRLARGLHNRIADDTSSTMAEPLPYPIQGWFLGKLKPAATRAGRTDLVSLWSGQIAPDLRHRTAPELMDALAKELEPEA